MLFRSWIGNKTRATLIDTGLLILRIGFGLSMLMAHGWGKLTGFGERASQFPDPIGLGNTTSMALAVFAEFFCSLGLVAGLLTRLAAIPLMTTMLVAFFIVHGSDPFKARELALVYLIAYLTIFVAGPGRFSLDALVFGKKKD